MVAFGEVGLACDTKGFFASGFLADAASCPVALCANAGDAQISALSEIASGIIRRHAFMVVFNISPPVTLRITFLNEDQIGRRAVTRVIIGIGMSLGGGSRSISEPST